ncbi:uncharacterized protein LOC128554916 [Mercenaria mercenaria]|uniref:uncharacterized protein LOC128554916 n=1 Tax=Mercenaria mercenaria TaxID=6596 RepID=UPI00234E50E7|nr:uncharacterized protein LOC128554916 [Mercenaria mercenaria]
MSFQVETDAIPIPQESDDTANAIFPQTNSGSLNIADTHPLDQVTNDQNNDDLSNQTIQEPLTDLVLPPRPPKDFELNNFLLHLAEDMEHDDLEKMKFLLSGDGGISTKEREQIKSPLDLFKQLKKRSLISRHDILYLQLMLIFTGKKKNPYVWLVNLPTILEGHYISFRLQKSQPMVTSMLNFTLKFRML